MKYNPNLYNRRSYRLKGHDYSKAGLYFITICIKNRDYIFGNVIDSAMELNDIGRIADDCWLEIPKHFPKVELCEYIVMPNHIHGILHLKQDGLGKDDAVGFSGVGTSHVISLQDNPNKNPSNDDSDNQVMFQQDKSIPLEYKLFPPIFGFDFIETNKNIFSKPVPGSVSVIIQQYKAAVKRNGKKINYDELYWQSRFYDHIIRDEQSYVYLAEYIINNPKNWKEDQFFEK
jgi:putative transposase